MGKGLTPQQAAGVVGNMISESGVLPKRLQNTPPSRETEAQDAESSRLGWGLVQWTPASKIITVSNRNGVSYSDIGTMSFQLDFLWDSLNGTGYAPNEKVAGNKLKATTTVEDAAVSFGKDFERFAGSDDLSNPKYTERKNNAIKVLALYGGGASPGGTSPSGGSSCVSVGQFEGSTKKVAFTGPEIDVRGVVLHWTAGPANSTVDQFINQIKSNNACGDAGCSVQFYVDGSGKVYQLVDKINTLTYHALGANSCCVGIEIGGRGESDLLNNPVQKQAVINLVAYLVRTFNIDSQPDLNAKRGVMSHHQISSNGKIDVGNAYYYEVMNAVFGAE